LAVAKETTYAEILGAWSRMIQPVKANGAELGHLEVPIAKFEALWAQAIEISAAQAARTAAKQEASKQLKQLLVEGQRLRTVLQVSIKEHYGIRSEKLTEFGLQPFRGRRRKPAEVPDRPAASAPVETEAMDAPVVAIRGNR
jgi:hypothetical protein